MTSDRVSKRVCYADVSVATTAQTEHVEVLAAVPMRLLRNYTPALGRIGEHALLKAGAGTGRSFLSVIRAIESHHHLHL